MLSFFIWGLKWKLDNARLIWSYFTALLNLKHAVDVIIISTSLSAKCYRCRPIYASNVSHFHISIENFSWPTINYIENWSHPSLQHGIAFSFMLLFSIWTWKAWKILLILILLWNVLSCYLYFFSFPKRFLIWLLKFFLLEFLHDRMRLWL